MDMIEARFKIDWRGFTLDVDLHLPGQGVTALFGHSGSGKTTLLRCIAGLERAPVGRLVVAGEPWQDTKHWLPTHRRPIGYVFQEPSLFPHLDVMGNLRYGMRRVATGQHVGLDHAIELLGIAPLLGRAPDRLSGGERQRVAIARALAVGPRLLLMDEPLAALDLKRKREILPYLDRLHDELKIPVLYVSHSPEEVVRLADHLVALEGGRVMADGPLREMLSRLDLPVRLGEDTATIVHATVAEVDDAWHLARLDFPGGSLWTRDPGYPIGRAVRVRILARDVSLATEPGNSSIQNTLPARVDGIAHDDHPALALVRVRVGDALLLASLTHRAVAHLKLAPGQAVWAQVKSVALLE